MLLEDADLHHQQRTSSSACSSPIYAVPYEGSTSSSTAHNSPGFRHGNNSPVYAKVCREPNRNSGIYQCVRRVAEDVTKRCPLQIESPFYASNRVAPAQRPTCATPSDAEFDFLAELDKQIAELQVFF